MAARAQIAPCVVVALASAAGGQLGAVSLSDA
jgi:hypothetical protein